MSDQRDGGIAWTDQTWNPTRGCWPVSPGCLHCYAAGVAARFSGPGQPYEGLAKRSVGKSLPQWTGEGAFVADHLADPLRWKRPRRVFVNSMSDLFFERFTIHQIAEVFAVMLLSPHHTYQVLTKRPERMLAVITAPEFYGLVLGYADILRAQRPELCNVGISNPALVPAPWIWLGVSTENQATADERIPLLLQTPAAVRFISAEPLLGPIDLTKVKIPGAPSPPWAGSALHRYRGFAERIDWVIIGGESGPRAREFDLGWGKGIVDQCQEAGVPCFFKQAGSNPVLSHKASDMPHRLSFADRKGGDLSELPLDLQVREFPEVRHG